MSEVAYSKDKQEHPKAFSLGILQESHSHHKLSRGICNNLSINQAPPLKLSFLAQSLVYLWILSNEFQEIH